MVGVGTLGEVLIPVNSAQEITAIGNLKLVAWMKDHDRDKDFILSAIRHGFHIANTTKVIGEPIRGTTELPAFNQRH